MKTAAHAHDHPLDFQHLSRAVTAAFDAQTMGEGAVFTTDADSLFEMYLACFPEAEMQIHNCNTCRRFIERFGGLVRIDEAGQTYPLMWAPPGHDNGIYAALLHDLHAVVRNAKVTGVFLSKEPVWGTPEAGGWTHLTVTPPKALIYRETTLTAGQAMAAVRERRKNVLTALTEFKTKALDDALRLLKGEFLARSEKFVGPVQWLRDLHDRPKGRAGDNLLWRSVALAPEGFCHPRAAVTGSLLEDIVAGLQFDDIKRKFDAKLAPLQYQRPQAAPTAGNIKAAEAVIEKMGLAPSLERRFLRIEEIPVKTWSPKDVAPAAPAGGVFGHLTPKGADDRKPLDLPVKDMTWDKFRRTVLPTAEKIDAIVPGVGNFIAMVTATNPDAPPLLKWDRDDARNPVNHYVYPSGSPAAQWRLTSGARVTVNVITPLPHLWGDRPMTEQGDGVIFVLDGCADTFEHGGNALFPEVLKSELHGVRATIEAYSRGAQFTGRAEATACGLMLRATTRMVPITLYVFSEGAWAGYHVDRWD